MTDKFTLPALALAFSACLGAFHVVKTPVLDWEFAIQPSAVPQNDTPEFATVFEYDATAGTAHSAAIRMTDQGFAIIWFDGTRESHNDVIIKQAHFEKTDDDWVHSPPTKFFNKEELSQVTKPRQKLLTLGNTIQYGTDENKSLATVVSLGGWAAASIALIDTTSDTPVSVRKLSLSPFLNRSQLVRGPTVSYTDGSIAIPAYLELGNAFGEFVRLDSQGRVRHKRRMSQRRFAIQPMIVPLDDQNAVALMRNFDDDTDRLIATWTTDGGRAWSDPTLLDLPNPSAPVAAVLLSDQSILMAYNETPDTLNLALSKDQGRTWETLHTLEQDNGNARYPAMSVLPDGDIALTYSTGSKKGIKAVIFNEAWVLAK